MTDRFEGVWQKVKRAKHHVDQLDEAIRVLAQEDPYTILVKDHSEPGKRVAYVAHVEPFLPGRLSDLSLIVGDAVHNLRSALDHFVYQVVPANMQESCEFPVVRQARAPTPNELKALAGGKVKGAPKGVIEAICRLEPYKGGNGDYVWRLHYLDRMDKHRLLITVGSSYRSFLFSHPPLTLPDGKRVPSPGVWVNVGDRQIIEEGVELLVGPPEIVEAEKKLQFRFDVSLNEPRVFDREPVAPTLRHLIDSVEALLHSLISIA